jgi:hypothetical protein
LDLPADIFFHGIFNDERPLATKGVITLYLKRIKLGADNYRYILRETYSDDGILKSRDLVDIGADPRTCIRYPGGNAFYFDSAIEEALQEKGVRFTSQDLEDIFVPYLEPRFQYILRTFSRRGAPTRTDCNLAQLSPGHDRVHIFDARRLYYLRFGRTDSGELGLKHLKFLNIFLCKSRDEIESMIEAMESRLPPGEFATYVYASLGVPLFFSQFMRDYPSALDPEKLDGYVVQELCRLNSDEDYLRGVEWAKDTGLHPYLTKYAWLYFDFEFQTETWEEAFGFQANFSRPAPRKISVEHAYELFGISAQRFAAMSKRELTRIYRRKAKKLHPDQGGVHEEFLRFSEAYEQLLALKK